MVFSSTVFLVWFLPFFLLLYHLMDRKYKNYFILLSSAVFYSWGGPVFIFAILVTTFLDFHLVKWMSDQVDPGRKKKILVLSLSLNLGMLCVFKYANFFMDTADILLNQLGFESFGWTRIALPIGISFYTFESITYVVDSYRKVHPPQKKFSDYLLYILFFPKLLAGPIVRYHEFADQIHDRFSSFKQDDFLNGFYRFVTGLSKKLLLANVVGEMAHKVFEQDSANLSAAAAWVGLVAYSMQIYFDFSGYSDIAIGLGQMLGFRIPENFDNPYVSKNISEFWTRWHMSFGRWMKNYLYIPLGGNKKGAGRTYFNLILVFFFSGLWHGASWKWVLWGFYNGFFILLQKVTENIFPFRIPGVIRTIFTYFIVLMGFVIVCPKNFSNVNDFFSALLGFGNGNFAIPTDIEFWFTLSLTFLFSFWNLFPKLQFIQNKWYGQDKSDSGHITMTVLCISLYILCLSYATWSPFNPFIYLRF